jgi:hypothetical protein
MWHLVNNTPFAAERAFVRDQNGAEVWLVAVKGTFAIKSDGSTALAEKQVEVCLAPKYLGEPGKSSLAYETDLVHTKPGTDVILHGHAYAPAGKPVTSVDVMMNLGKISKTLRVFGDRFWELGLIDLKMTAPKPFVKMPIIYERAFGGVDQKSENPKKHRDERRNPIGTGFAVTSEHLVGQRLPNIEDPQALISLWKKRHRPAGFGPIARDWSPRVELAGTYDEIWEKERLPLLPVDFDQRFYQCAPEDQQVPGYLRGGEAVELYNLSPEGLLRFTLPYVWLTFSTSFGRATVAHRAKLHTVILEPDFPRVIMVWHTHLLCHNKEHKLEQTVIAQKRMLALSSLGYEKKARSIAKDLAHVDET